MADGSPSLKQVCAIFKGHARVDGDALFGKAKAATKPIARPAPPTRQRPLSAVQEKALEAMRRKLQIARYSPNAIDTCLNASKQLSLRFAGKHPNDIRTEELRPASTDWPSPARATAT
ncbi:MAG: hypothetical protein ACK4L7_10415 [Flavobacteriales bacterium]